MKTKDEKKLKVQCPYCQKLIQVRYKMNDPMDMYIAFEHIKSELESRK